MTYFREKKKSSRRFIIFFLGYLEQADTTSRIRATLLFYCLLSLPSEWQEKIVRTTPLNYKMAHITLSLRHNIFFSWASRKAIRLSGVRTKKIKSRAAFSRRKIKMRITPFHIQPIFYISWWKAADRLGQACKVYLFRGAWRHDVHTIILHTFSPVRQRFVPDIVLDNPSLQQMGA